MRRGNHASPSVWALRLAGGAALAVVWEIAARALDSLLLPSFTSTVVALVGLVGSRELWHALGVSNETLAAGFAATLLVGVPAGLALGRWPRIDRWIDPYLTLLLTLPASALIPLIFIVAGLGLASRAALVCLFALPVVVECARDGVRQVDPRLTDMAAAFGATSRQQWRKVLLPGAVPGIMTGARLGLARAVEGMIVVEILLVAVGLGGLLLDYQGRFEAGHVYAVVLVVMAEAVVLTALGRVIERRLVGDRDLADSP